MRNTDRFRPCSHAETLPFVFEFRHFAVGRFVKFGTFGNIRKGVLLFSQERLNAVSADMHFFKKLFTPVAFATVLGCLVPTAVSAREFTYSGTFSVPSVGLYTEWVQEWDSSRWQSIVNSPENSLLFFMDNLSTPMLGDHNTQDFAALPLIKEGDAGIMIMSGGTALSYECTHAFEGYNAEYYLATMDGVPIQNVYDADLILYTCMRSDANPEGAFVTMWKELR